MRMERNLFAGMMRSVVDASGTQNSNPRLKYIWRMALSARFE